MKIIHFHQVKIGWLNWQYTKPSWPCLWCVDQSKGVVPYVCEKISQHRQLHHNVSKVGQRKQLRNLDGSYCIIPALFHNWLDFLFVFSSVFLVQLGSQTIGRAVGVGLIEQGLKQNHTSSISMHSWTAVCSGFSITNGWQNETNEMDSFVSDQKNVWKRYYLREFVFTYRLLLVSPFSSLHSLIQSCPLLLNWNLADLPVLKWELLKHRMWDSSDFEECLSKFPHQHKLWKNR